MGQLSFGNMVEIVDFPNYDSSMLIPELDCSADCTFSSCSGKGNCTCSCSWFKCTCKKKEQSIDPQERVSMNKEQYEKTKLLALVLKSLDENE